MSYDQLRAQYNRTVDLLIAKPGDKNLIVIEQELRRRLREMKP